MAKIYVVGIGPGSNEFIASKACSAIKESDIVVGYKKYIELIKNYIVGKEVFTSTMKKEIDRCKKAYEYAKTGKTVSLVSSGDAGIYGMAGIMYEVLNNEGNDIEIEVIPGITAVNAAAACLGAPLMHDFCVISLSDLLTDWGSIEKRLALASEGDFVIALYNPKSLGRPDNINKARNIMKKYKKEDTVVGIVKNAKRKDEEIYITDLENMLSFNIDMSSLVIIGNSKTYVANGKMITPRGYQI